MKETVFIVLFTWFLGNMGIHLLTPQLPALTEALHTTSQLAQLSISVFLLGKSLGVLVWGPLSESHGRRPYLLAGLILYGTASLFISASSHIGLILVLRFAQGLGVSATVLMGRTIINDCFPEKKAIKAFALLFTVAGIIIAFLPMLGGLIAHFAHWQVAFYVMSAYAFFIFFISYRYLPETAPKVRQAMSLMQVIADYRLVIQNPLFLSYLFISALMVAGESAFNTSASFILIKTHGLSPTHYGAIKTSLGIAHLLGSAVCAYAIRFVSPRALIGLGVTSFLAASLLMLTFNVMGMPLSLALLIPMLIYYFGTGFIVATVSAAVVRPFPKKMATAMAFCLFLQFLTSSGFSFLVSLINIQTVMPLTCVLIGVSGLNVVLWLATIKRREDKASAVST